MASQPASAPISGLTIQSTADIEPKLRTSATQVDATRRSPNPAQVIIPGVLPIQQSPNARTDASIEEYKMFITLVFGVSIFGASTFAVSIGQMTDPADIWRPKKAPFAMETVRTFLGAAWLCFILTIAVAGFSTSLLTLLKNQDEGIKDTDRKKKLESIAIPVSALLWTLLVAAFLFLSLAMVPYAYSLLDVPPDSVSVLRFNILQRSDTNEKQGALENSSGQTVR
ncbi:hypothetical protein ACHAPJ_001977 [Fusarium lateritium]